MTYTTDTSMCCFTKNMKKISNNWTKDDRKGLGGCFAAWLRTSLSCSTMVHH